jgi:hypothetical protein
MSGKVVTLEFETEEAAEAYANIAKLAADKMYLKSVELDYHTNQELYEHRHTLFCALVFSKTYRLKAWKSLLHYDGTMFDGYFIVGINLVQGHSAYSTRRNDITYHLPLSWWDKFNGLTEYEKAPEWDGCTPEEGLVRLSEYTDEMS